MTVSFEDKLVAVVCGCKTIDQLNNALNYAKLALKGGHIGVKKFHFIWGSIVALKGFLKDKGEVSND